MLKLWRRGSPADPSLPYAVVDLETTGFRTATDRIYEIGIVVVDGEGQVLETYETLVRPDGEFELSERIGPAVAEAPTFADIAGDVVARLRDRVIVAHNIGFDLGMLDAELRRLGYGVPTVDYLCTLDLATLLAIDAPSRSLGVLCHVLDVPMNTWHTAAGDAEVTGRLLLRLLSLADERGLGNRARQPSRLESDQQEWPGLPRSHRRLARDPKAFPPIGQQPESLDVLASGRGNTVSMSLLDGIHIDPELMAKAFVALARKALRDRPDRKAWPPEVMRLVPVVEADDLGIAATAARTFLDWIEKTEDPTADVRDDWERQRFVGEKGVTTLHRIVAAFETAKDDDLWRAKLRLAQQLRYQPKHGAEEANEAYRAAYESALEADEEFDEEAPDEVLDDWLAYRIAQQDVAGVAELVRMSPSRSAFDPSYGVTKLISQLAQGDSAVGGAACSELAEVFAEIGSPRTSGDICETWARALAERGDVADALRACDDAWIAGWGSRNLANRHSLILERAKRWPEAAAVCERGLVLAPGDEQISKRLSRCSAKAVG